jgi:hypothetical protein
MFLAKFPLTMYSFITRGFLVKKFGIDDLFIAVAVVR